MRKYVYATLAAIAILLVALAFITPANGQEAEVCYEDMPCWDCETMGNQVCGPIEPWTPDPVLIVDGAVYYPSKISGPTVHFETPDVNPFWAYSWRHTWTGHGSENLPCEGGIHWIDNENVLTVSHCLPVITTTTTTSPTTTSTTTPSTTTTSTSIPTTTTTEATTTTTDPTTTTSSSTTTQPPTDTTSTSSPPASTTSVPPTTTTVPTLPKTGFNSGVLAATSLLLLVLGIATLVGARRRAE